MKLRLGSRGSALAMTQAREMARRITELDHEVEIVCIKTEGDADQQSPFAQVGLPGLFVRSIETALIEGHIDLALHCYKDLPSDSPAELQVVAMPEREDTRDVLLVAPAAFAARAEQLPLVPEAVVGTASARRQALLRHLRSDLSWGLLRGNLQTRLQRLREGKFDAILLAAAGLARLERGAQRGEGNALAIEGLERLDLDPTIFVPAPSQGALALQARRDNGDMQTIAAALDQPDDHRAVRAERFLLALVDAGCQVPFGAYARKTPGGSLELHAALEVNGELRRARARGGDPESLARKAFEELLGNGAQAQ